ncbi:MAG: hypothetical protein ACYS8W_19530 [Planctomycetota bacterium]
MSRINLRPITAGDRDDILEFSRELFDGWDYLDKVFDSWLKIDETKTTLVAEISERAVALVRVMQFSRGEWWIEGLRADRKLPPNVIAACMLALRRGIIDFLKTREVRTFRYSTLLTNTKSRRIAKVFGFKETLHVPHFVGTFKPVSPLPDIGLEIERPGEKTFAIKDLSSTIRQLSGHSCFHLWWLDREITPEFVRELCIEGRLWIGKSGGEIVSAAALVHFDWMNFHAVSLCGKSAGVIAPLVPRMSEDLNIPETLFLGMSCAEDKIGREMQSIFAPESDFKHGVLMELSAETLARHLRGH